MYYLSVTCTCTIDFDQFEFQRSLIRINFLLPDLQNFKSLESGDVHQNFLSSESWALGLQNLQHLNRNTIFRSWDCSSELPVSESSVCLLSKSSELSEADYLHDQKHVFRSALERYCLRVQLLMECLLPQSQNLFYNLCSKR